jgi:hypothetical protein
MTQPINLLQRRVTAAREHVDCARHYLEVFAGAHALQQRGADELAVAAEKARLTLEAAELELAALLED